MNPFHNTIFSKKFGLFCIATLFLLSIFLPSFAHAGVITTVSTTFSSFVKNIFGSFFVFDNEKKNIEQENVLVTENNSSLSTANLLPISTSNFGTPTTTFTPSSSTKVIEYRTTEYVPITVSVENTQDNITKVELTEELNTIRELISKQADADHRSISDIKVSNSVTTSVDLTTDWLGTLDGLEGSYFLSNSFSTTSADVWLATKDLSTTTFDANNLTSLSIGFDNEIIYSDASAVGYQNTTSGQQGSSFGYRNTSTGTSTVAVGFRNTATGLESNAFGSNNTASNLYSSAFGYGNTASGNNSYTFGNSNIVSVSNAGVIGSNIENNISGSLQIGLSDTAKLTMTSSGDIGVGTTTPNGRFVVAGGVDTPRLNLVGIANQTANMIELRNASGTVMVSVGPTGVISGDGSGLTNVGIGVSLNTLTTLAIGADNVVSGTDSGAFGFDNNATGTARMAIGNGITNNTDNSIEIGASDTNKVRIDASGLTLSSGSFSGSGSGITGLNASAITTGTLSMVRLSTSTTPTNQKFLRGDGAWMSYDYIQGTWVTNVNANSYSLSNVGALTANTFSGNGASLTNLNASNLTSGTVATSRLGSGTASASTFLRGDGAWTTIGEASQTPWTSDIDGGGYNVTNVSSLTASAFSGNGVNITNISGTNISSGIINVARLGTGTASSTSYLRGDGTWAELASTELTPWESNIEAAGYNLSNVGILTTTSITGEGSGLTGLNASALLSGTVNVARLGSGTANSNTFLRGDGTWATAPGAQTPWAQNIDGAGFDLLDVGQIDAEYFTFTGSATSTVQGPLAGNSKISAAYFIASSTSASVFNGNITLPGLAKIGIGTSSPYAKLSIAGTADETQFVIYGNDSQTKNLIEIRNASGTTLASVGPTGIISGDGSGLTNLSISSDVNTLTTIRYGFGNSVTGGTPTASAIGYQNIASAINASAFGYQNTVTNTGGSAFGYGNTVSGEESTAIGYGNTISVASSTIIGRGITNATAQSVEIGPSNSNKIRIDANGLNVIGSGCLAINGSCMGSSQWETNDTSISYNTGFVGIGTSSPYAKLSVTGTIVGANFVGTTTATSTLGGGVNITTGCFAVNGTCLSTSGFTGMTGTTNYLTRWTDANTLGIGQVYDNGTNVGIGTASPGSYNKLDIQGSEALGYGVGLSVRNTSTAAQSYALYRLNVGSGEEGGMFFGSKGAVNSYGIANGITFRAGTITQDIAFSVGNTITGGATGPSMLLKSSGNLGIGELLPGSRLSVSGGATIGTSYDTTVAPTNGLLVQGNVGIGTTSATAPLTVSGQIRSNSIIRSEGESGTLSGTGPGAEFGYSSVLGAAYVQGWNRTTNALTPISYTGSVIYFRNASGYVGIINALGNMGVGELSPGSRLSVSGGATIGTSYDTTVAPTNGLLVEGNVGIGTSSPFAKLSVVGNIFGSAQASFGNTGNRVVFNNQTAASPVGYFESDYGVSFSGYTIPNSTAHIINGTTGDIGYFSNTNQTVVLVPGSGGYAATFMGGNVGVGTSSPLYGLHVQSSASGVVAGFTNTSGTCTIDPTSTALSCSSDIALKKDVVNLSATSTLEKLMDIQGVNYRWKNEDSTGDLRFGFIAQEVEQVFPEFVTTGPDGFKAVAYNLFIPVLTESVKGLKLELDAIEQPESSLFKKILTAFESIGLKFTDTFINFQRRVLVPEICVGDETDNVCLTKEQIRDLLGEPQTGNVSDSTTNTPSDVTDIPEESIIESATSSDTGIIETSVVPNPEDALTTPTEIPSEPVIDDNSSAEEIIPSTNEDSEIEQSIIGTPEDEDVSAPETTEANNDQETGENVSNEIAE